MSDLDMSVSKHRAFVDSLIDDDNLRARFAADPKSVLQEHGIGYDPARSLAVGKAPSVDALKNARSTIITKLDDSGGWDALDSIDTIDPGGG
jgi:hypothetical protein